MLGVFGHLLVVGSVVSPVQSHQRMNVLDVFGGKVVQVAAYLAEYFAQVEHEGFIFPGIICFFGSVKEP